MSKFTVVIAGFGWWGRHFAERLKDHPAIRVAGVVEPVEANHEAIRALGLTPMRALSEALGREDVEGVILATPNTLHEEQVIACAEAGKHVYCEKPLTLTAASARRAAEACQAAGVQLAIGHEMRFDPAMQALKAALDAGELGTIMHAEAAFSHDKLIHVPKGDWRTSKRHAPAAAMTAMGIHVSDLLISFLGPVETVQAMTASRSLGWETGDVVTVQLGFEAGMTATFSAVLHTPHFMRMHVFGTERWDQILHHSHPDAPGGAIDYQIARSGAPVEHRTLHSIDGVLANLEAFARAARGEAPYPIPVAQIVHNIELLEAIARSAEDRRTVSIAELRG
ncbi:MAG: gfo/Idh/MocA family oxidoreductase [Alphaproteobacteria bacterium]|nr:MAG: gfo/Idh/MocA family oxidoreductase [Alphaproteobacteria bacterium]